MWEAKLVAILMLILMLASCQLWARGKGAVSGGRRGRMANRSIFVVKISNVHFILIHFMWLLILRSNSLIFWPQIYNTQEARRHTHTLRQAGQHTDRQRGSQKEGERDWRSQQADKKCWRLFNCQIYTCYQRWRTPCPDWHPFAAARQPQMLCEKAGQNREKAKKKKKAQQGKAKPSRAQATDRKSETEMKSNEE